MRTLLTIVGVLLTATMAAAQCRTLQQSYPVPTGQAIVASQTIQYQPAPVLPVPSCVPAAPPCQPALAAYAPAPCQQPAVCADTTALAAMIAQYLQSQQPAMAYAPSYAPAYAAPAALPVSYAIPAYTTATYAPSYYLPQAGFATRSYSYYGGRSFSPAFAGSYYGGRSFAPVVATTGGFGAFGTGVGTGFGPPSLIGQFRQGVSTGGLAGGLERFTGLGNGSGQFVGGALTGILATRANLFGLGKGIR